MLQTKNFQGTGLRAVTGDGDEGGRVGRDGNEPIHAAAPFLAVREHRR